MIWEQPGHLTHRPSGTRLVFSFDEGAMGFLVFLNQAIGQSLHRTAVVLTGRGPVPPGERPEAEPRGHFVRGT